MSYRVLARKYRPASFDQVIGQAHVAKTLTNALTTQKVAHAYLFSGPRGVGKTTVARILAKCLNCVNGPTATPCLKCESCQRLASGQEQVDIIEIDAASNRGIDEIRELREHVRYAPAQSRYKVFIIDEAHQITNDAFNALLKTLEEPPPHAIFVLATTEHQKIPLTILSRCQLFRFRRVGQDELVGHLVSILKQEERPAPIEALQRIAKAGGGSVRDALSLLDQSLALSETELTLSHVESLLGLLPQERLEAYVETLLKQDSKQMLTLIEQLYQEGWDLLQFVKDVRDFLRERLVHQMGSSQTPALQVPQALYWMKLLGTCAETMRWSDFPRLELELVSLKLLQPFVDIGELMEQLKRSEIRDQRSEKPVLRSEGSVQKPISVTTTPSSSVSSDLTPGSIHRPSPTVTAVSSPLTDVSSIWKKTLAELWKKPTVATAFERAVVKSASAQEFVIALPDKFALTAAQRGLLLLQEILTKLIGSTPVIRLVQEVPKEEDSSVVVPRAERVEEKALLENPAVQSVLDAFGGRVRLEEGAE